MTPNWAAQNPFKGLDPFGPGDQLFGRDPDLLLMKDRIFRGPTTLLFAASGVGKTSFFRARFIPEVAQRYREQFVVHYHSEWAGKDPLLTLKWSLGIDERESLRAFFRRRAETDRKTWLLILDQ